jgi:hypothetical protein
MKTLKTTARTTGILYLLLGIAGMLTFLVIRPAIYVAGDPGATLAKLVENEGVARIGIAFELLTVLAQAVLAVWFFKLFRSVNTVAAGSVAAFGLVNAVAILGSVAFSATALTVALDSSLSPAGDTAATVQLMYVLGGAFWSVGAIFFGLWLIPMGYLVLVSRWMPRPLGWILVAGGVAYVLSAFVTYLLPDAPDLVETVLSGIASIGEFWMIGYLLILGVRRTATIPTPAPAVAASAA